MAQRWSIDNITFYSLTLRLLPPATATQQEGKWSLMSNSLNNTILFDLMATTTETPLTPVPTIDLLTPTALSVSTERSRNELAFLVYEEALLAGADNYLTMFGRDNQFVLAIGAKVCFLHSCCVVALLCLRFDTSCCYCVLGFSTQGF